MDSAKASQVGTDPDAAGPDGDALFAAARASGLPMVITDPHAADNPIVFVNDAFLAMTGYERDEVLGRNCRFLQGPGTSPAALDTIRSAIQNRDSLKIDLLNYRKSGEPFWNTLYISPVADQGGALRYFFGAQLDATEAVGLAMAASTRRSTPEGERAELEKASSIQRLLLQEIDHRAKNNMQMVSAMLTLQAMSIPDQAVQQTLGEMLERVSALALVHKRLYELSQLTRFDVADYVRELVDNLIGAAGRRDIVVHLGLEPVVIGADIAASVALIVNEALTNALKHGFKDGRSGVLKVELRQAGATCLIRIVDDGPGFAVDPHDARTFGTTLIETLIEQLHARLAWQRLDPGTLFEIEFPISPPVAAP